jgi:hypothetical protein
MESAISGMPTVWQALLTGCRWLLAYCAIHSSEVTQSFFEFHAAHVAVALAAALIGAFFPARAAGRREPAKASGWRAARRARARGDRRRPELRGDVRDAHCGRRR